MKKVKNIVVFALIALTFNISIAMAQAIDVQCKSILNLNKSATQCCMKYKLHPNEPKTPPVCIEHGVIYSSDHGLSGCMKEQLASDAQYTMVYGAYLYCGYGQNGQTPDVYRATMGTRLHMEGGIPSDYVCKPITGINNWEKCKIGTLCGVKCEPRN